MILLWLLGEYHFLPQLFTAPLSLTAAKSLSALPLLLLMFIFSLLLGGMAVAIGQLSNVKLAGPDAKVRRALRIGRLNNTALLQEFIEVKSRHEVATAFYGTVLLGVIFFFISIFQDWVIAREISIDMAHIARHGSNFKVGLLGVVLSWFIRYSANSGIRAIDQALDEEEGR